MADEEENECCPLCMEELDITDKTFNACPCGYQVCLWCWHQIKNEYNALCPACRAPYSELSKQKSPLDREDVLRRTKQRKQKEKSERRSASQSKIPTVNRRNLANVRVMQRNLVYVIGLPQSVADDDILRSPECFGQYGKIVKAVVNKTHLNSDRSNATASAYITFASKDDALSCILAVDGFFLDGSLLRASFGTTKYCNFFLRSMTCSNPDCLYLHELGEQDDSFTKDEMQSALHASKAAFRELSTNDIRAGSRFPPPVKRTNGSAASATSAASAASAATMDRRAQSAAAVHKLRSQTSTSSSSARSELRRGNSYSRIVTGFAGSSSSSSSSSPRSSPPSSPSPSPSPPPGMDDRKPNLRVDTTLGRPTTADSVVGPLEALKLATGSTSEEPAWAMPFPSPSIQHSDDEALPVASDPVFGPFGGLGFDHMRASATAEEHDPWTSSSKARSPMGEPEHTLPTRLNAQPSGFPLGLNGGSAPSGQARSGLSGLSFASIDAIFSQRDEPVESSLSGLLGGVPLAPPPTAPTPAPVAAPLVQSSPSIGNGIKNARSSRFAFANQPTQSHQSELRDAPPMPSGLPPVSPYRPLTRHSSFRDVAGPPPSSMFPSPNDPRAFPPLGGSTAPPPPPPLPPTSTHAFARSTSDPFPSSGFGDSNGLAFLQQMLPNVNISYGGDFPSSPSPASPAQDVNGWGGLGSLGLGGGSSQSHASHSPSPFYDPAIVAAPGLSGFYGLGGEDDRLRQQSQSAFGGFRQ